MSAAVAGATAGIFMASVFVCIAPLMLFFISRDPPRFLQGLLVRLPPLAVMMILVILSYPVWVLIGFVIGVFYGANTSESTGSGIGSPNMAYTLAVVGVGVVVAAPLVVLLRKVIVGLTAVVFSFIGIFGWLLPFLAG